MDTITIKYIPAHGHDIILIADGLGDGIVLTIEQARAVSERLVSIIGAYDMDRHDHIFKKMGISDEHPLDSFPSIKRKE